MFLNSKKIQIYLQKLQESFLEENEENRKAQLYAQALANEGGSAENWKNNVSSIGTLINTIFGGTSRST